MNGLAQTSRSRRSPNNAGSLLIIVLWVAFGLVAMTLYFAHSMALEMRAADNRVAALQAEQAIEGAARYVAYLLANNDTSRLDIASNQIGLDQNRPAGAFPVGNAWFWL